MVGIISMLCIIISTIIVTLDTLPYFQVNFGVKSKKFDVFCMLGQGEEHTGWSVPTIHHHRVGLHGLVFSRAPCKASFITKQGERAETKNYLHGKFQIKFIKEFMNIVDVVAILPYYISICFYR